jgi:hypothetical protein
LPQSDAINVGEALAAFPARFSIVAKNSEITARNSEQEQRMITAAIAGKPRFRRRTPAFWLFFTWI